MSQLLFDLETRAREIVSARQEWPGRAFREKPVELDQELAAPQQEEANWMAAGGASWTRKGGSFCFGLGFGLGLDT